MRIFSIVLISALAGILVGGAVAYVEVSSDADATGLPGDKPAKSVTALPTDGNVARLVVEEPNFNFGQMQLGRKKSHEFVLKNVGAAPLTLRVGQTSCKCTIGDVTQGPIAPGGSGVVRLEWTARGGNGPFRQTATIHTNDPLNSEVQLSVEGEVTEAQGIEPSELAFDTITVGDQKSAVVHVMAMLQDNLTVTDPQLSDETTRDKFDVQIEPVDKASLPNPAAKSGMKITLTAKPGLPVGRFNQWLAVKTNLEDDEHLEIPVSGRIVGDISVHGIGWSEEQGVLILGSVKSSEGRKQTLNIVVRGEGAADVKFEVQSCDPPELKVKIGEARKLKDALVHVPLEIEIPPGTRPMVRTETAQGEAGRIVLATTHAKIKELALSVRFSVER
jgi:hypothetical protein